MPVPLVAVIAQLAPRAFDDPELKPKLAEHELTPADVRQALLEHSGELATAVRAEQQGWDEADDAVRQASAALSAYRAQPARRRAWLALTRELLPGPLFPFTSKGPPPGPRDLMLIEKTAQHQASEREKAWWAAAYTQWVRRQVTSLINDYEDPSYRSTLPPAPGSGLAEVYHPEYEVPTAAGIKLSGLFTHMPGGSIGLCGFRGSGKTTLIGSLCRTQSESADGGPSLGFVVSAPVRYEPREFILAGRRVGRPRSAGTRAELAQRHPLSAHVHQWLVRLAQRLRRPGLAQPEHPGRGAPADRAQHHRRLPGPGQGRDPAGDQALHRH